MAVLMARIPKQKSYLIISGWFSSVKDLPPPPFKNLIGGWLKQGEYQPCCFSFSFFRPKRFFPQKLFLSQVLIKISCKIFEPLGSTSRIQQLSSKLGSTPFKDGATLAPKLIDLLSPCKSGSTPFYTGSGILDPD
jgi:hypothetical protein